MSDKNTEQERAVYEKAIKNPNIPENVKEIARKKLADLDAKTPKKEVKEKVVKQPQPKKEKVVKQAEPKKEKAVESNDYDCDELISKEKETRKKRKIAAEKRASQPKKKPATKIKEGIETISDKIEGGVEKGNVSKAELEKLIASTKALLSRLEKQLEGFSAKKMAEGGNVEESQFKNMSAKDFVKEYYGINVFKSNPSEYFDIQKLSSSNDDKVEQFINKYKNEGYSIKKKSYSDFTGLLAAKRKNDINKFAKGGTIKKFDRLPKNRQANRKYTHFAIGKADGKILNGWEYKNYDQIDLMSDKKYYFDGDMIDMEYEKGEYTIQTAKKFISKGINPFDYNNWRKIDYSTNESAMKTKFLERNKFANGGSIPRTKKAIASDKNLRALPKGERVSRPYAIIKKANGKVFKRRNVNQFGKVKGDKLYSEYRPEHTDKDQKKRF